VKKPVRTHSFNGVVYDVVIEALEGFCDKPNMANTPTLVIPHDPSDTLKFLDTVIHEALHAACPAWSEERVARTATDIARLLWRLGFRLSTKS
jgi:hypothetical protein